MKYRFSVALFIVIVVVLVFLLYLRTPHLVVLLFDDGQTDFYLGIREYLERNDFEMEIVSVRVDQPMAKLEEVMKRYSNSYAIGPRLSTEALNIISLLEQYNIFAIAPLVTSPEVIGKSEYLMTLSSSDEIQVYEISERLEKDQVKKLLVVCDEKNPVYSEIFAKILKNTVKRAEIQIVFINSVDELVEYSFENFDSMLLITDGIVAGMIAQMASNRGFSGRIYGSDYTFTDALFETGLDSIEGMIVYSPFDFSKMRDSGFLNLQQAGAYDSLMIIHNLLAQKILPKEAYSYLVGRSFDGATGSFTIEKDLSALRKTNFLIVKGGKFEPELDER